MTTTPTCYHCQETLDALTKGPVQFRDTCPHCHTDAHACRNCEFYDPGSHRECRESLAEWVRDKERANRCEYFRLNTKAARSSQAKANSLAALDDLFKK